MNHMEGGEVKGYAKLQVWREAHELVLRVYHATKCFPKDELFGLTNQIRRSTVSIPANIVEGYARSSTREFVQFLMIALGSLAETEYYLFLARELKYLTSDQVIQIESQRKLVGKLLYGLMRAMKKKL